MPKAKKKAEETATLERFERALKKALNTPPEEHKPKKRRKKAGKKQR